VKHGTGFSYSLFDYCASAFGITHTCWINVISVISKIRQTGYTPRVTLCMRVRTRPPLYGGNKSAIAGNYLGLTAWLMTPTVAIATAFAIIATSSDSNTRYL